MTAIELDEPTVARIHEAVRAGESVMVPYEHLRRRRMLAKSFGLVSRLPVPRVLIRHGYEAAFAIEEHEPDRPFRHLSVLMPDEDFNHYAYQTIMVAFGFRRPFVDCSRWAEEVGFLRFAVNVIEPCDDEAWSDRKRGLPLGMTGHA